MHLAGLLFGALPMLLVLPLRFQTVSTSFGIRLRAVRVKLLIHTCGLQVNGVSDFWSSGAVLRHRARQVAL